VERFRLVGVGGGAGEQRVEVTSGQVRHRNPAHCLPRGRPGSKSTHKLEPRTKKGGEDKVTVIWRCIAEGGGDVLIGQ
jgi:hypothetical protein